MKKVISMILAMALVLTTIASITTVTYAATAQNDSAYVFAIKTDATENPFRFKFVLLDTDSESTTSRFFVIGSANYGAGPIHNAGNEAFSWDPTDPDTLSGYLNGTWLNQTNPTTTVLPTGTGSSAAIYTLIPKIKEHIDMNHQWAMPGYDDLTTAEKTTIICGVTVLSRDEHEKYKEIVGYIGDTAANHSNQNWLLRSPQTAAATNGLYISSSTGNRGAATITGTYRFRPCFWLGVDFFKEVKLDLANTGSAVKEILKANYTMDDLRGAGYTEDELNSLFVTVDESLTTSAQISGTMKPGYTLTATATGTDDETAASYQWQQAESENGEFTDISGATASTYTLKNAQAEKYVRVKARLSKNNGTVLGMAAYSEAKAVAAALIPGVADNTNGGQQAINLTYRLTVSTDAEGADGMGETARTYFLLDDTGSEDGKFMLIEASSVARLETNATQGVLYTDTTKNNKFDPEVEGNIAYWLKNTYATGKSEASAPVKSVLSNKLVPAFIPYLDEDHEWLTEGGCTQGPCTDDYVVKSPVAILSITELKQYRDRFGWAEGLEWESGPADFNMLRTPRQTAVNVRLLWRTNDNSGAAIGGGIVANNTSANTGALLRPVFWLSEDVFKNVKLDVTKMGDGVKEMLIENYSKADLQGIYTAEELEIIGYENVSVSGVTINGIPTVGSELTVKYNYSNSNPDAAENVKVQWMYCDTDNGTFSEIDGATGVSYVVAPAYLNKYIKAKVTPLDSAGNEGEAVMSNTLGKMGEPKVIDVTNPVFSQVGADYTVSFDITNNGEATSVCIIIAAYDKDNVMIEVNPKNVQIPAGSGKYSSELVNFTPDSETTVKAFVWNNLTDIIPLY